MQQRAAILADVRAFFARRGVLEVDVPVLARATVTDPHLDSFVVHSPVNAGDVYYLMPSPEFYLKRLLVAGIGPVYSLGHAFRAGEAGARHQPEFTMLEWYRPGWSLLMLMEEVEALVKLFIDLPVRRTSYRQLFMDDMALDPHAISLAEIRQLAQEQLSPAFDSDDKNVWLDFLFSHRIEPRLEGMVFVGEFPAAQAALAQTVEDAWGNCVADRIELYINGVEVANAYQEEESPDVLMQRFADHLRLREQQGKPLPPMDHVFLAAMQEGLPPCAGVALGFDRLVMLALGKASIGSVISFAHEF